MEIQNLRIFTAKIMFNGKDAKPKDVEMINFVLNLDVNPDTIDAVYQDLFERCIFIKFKSEGDYVEFLSKYENMQQIFCYENGNQTNVQINAALGRLKYVRVFNLPPEIEDSLIMEHFKKYRKILAFKRERYNQETKLPVFSGVRGINMELEAEIPQFSYFKYKQFTMKIKVYYEGIKERCYKCGEDNHKINDCPKSKETNSEQNVSQQNNMENNNEKAKYNEVLRENNTNQATKSKPVVTLQRMENIKDYINSKKRENIYTETSTDEENKRCNEKKKEQKKRGRPRSLKVPSQPRKIFKSPENHKRENINVTMTTEMDTESENQTQEKIPEILITQMKNTIEME